MKIGYLSKFIFARFWKTVHTLKFISLNLFKTYHPRKFMPSKFKNFVFRPLSWIEKLRQTLTLNITNIAQKMKFSIKDFFSKRDAIFLYFTFYLWIFSFTLLSAIKGTVWVNEGKIMPFHLEKLWYLWYLEFWVLKVSRRIDQAIYIHR